MTSKAVLRHINRIRRRIASFLEPTDPEEDPAWDIPINVSIQVAKALGAKVPVDESGYLFVAGASWADCRAFVLYTAIDEVLKCAMYLVRLRELIDKSSISPRNDRTSRLLVAHVLEEQHARERRLVELLVTLVLFETSNDQNYYRDLLLREDLDGLLSTNQDLQEFYGAPSNNISDSIKRCRERIRDNEKTIDLAKAWYRADRSPVPDLSKLRPGRLLSSIRSRVKIALPLMGSRERLLVGFSYAGYGQASESIHYSTNTRDYQLRQGDENKKVKALGMLNWSILRRVHQLLGSPHIPSIESFIESMTRAEPDEIVYNTVVRDLKVGDFVLAVGDLAEVLEVKESKYGYRSYHVKYLAEKPLPEVQEDWFPARYIQRFYTRERFLKHLQSMVSEGKVPKDIAEKMGQMDAEQLQPFIRASLKETWKLGLRNWVRENSRKSANG